MSKSCVEVIGVYGVLMICINSIKSMSESGVGMVCVYRVLVICVNGVK